MQIYEEKVNCKFPLFFVFLHCLLFIERLRWRFKNYKFSMNMKVKELVEKLNLQVLSGTQGLDREIDGCYVSDLLSDVMGNAEMGNVWVTLQTHKNVMAIASLKELACVVLVKGQTASDDTLEQSNEEGIPFLSTSMQTYETVGKIYQLLNQ